jgi:hypothetical protein
VIARMTKATMNANANRLHQNAGPMDRKLAEFAHA